MDLSEGKYLLGMVQLKYLTRNHISMLADAFAGDFEKGWKSPEKWKSVLPCSKEKLTTILQERDTMDVSLLESYALKIGAKIIYCTDTDFPYRLKGIPDPPCYLIYTGNLPNPDDLTIGVVGSRKTNDYGRRAIRSIVSKLVDRAGVHIVSGLAEGADSCAHKVALEENGFTSAFLGCGIDVVYPAFNVNLYKEIKENGCIFSEYPFGMPAMARNFPERNRLISGLSDGVLVVQGEKKSGSRITVGYGLEQGKDIYAIPGEFDNRLSALPHYLIESGQAKFCACAEDILEDFIDIGTVERISRETEIDAFKFASTDEERKVLSQLQKGRRDFETLLAASDGMRADDLMVFLTDLELEGVVRCCSGDEFVLTC